MFLRCYLASDEFNLTELYNYVTITFETEAKTLRPKQECLKAETEAEAKIHEAEAEVQALTSLLSIDKTCGPTLKQQINFSYVCGSCST